MFNSKESKNRTVYLLFRKNNEESDTDLYVGSTSLNVKLRLQLHKSRARTGVTSKIYSQMCETNIENWKILPIITFYCDRNTIEEFERTWTQALKTDLNTNSQTGLGITNYTDKNEYARECYKYNDDYRHKTLKRKNGKIICDKSHKKISRSYKAQHEKSKYHKAVVIEKLLFELE